MSQYFFNFFLQNLLFTSSQLIFTFKFLVESRFIVTKIPRSFWREISLFASIWSCISSPSSCRTASRSFSFFLYTILSRLHCSVKLLDCLFSNYRVHDMWQWLVIVSKRIISVHLLIQMFSSASIVMYSRRTLIPLTQLRSSEWLLWSYMRSGGRHSQHLLLLLVLSIFSKRLIPVHLLERRRCSAWF